MSKIITILFLCFFINNLSAHPLHMSVCNMDIKNDSLHFSIKLFTDDFNIALDKYEYDTAVESYIDSVLIYLQQNFVVQINHDNITYSIIDTTINELSIWINCFLPYKESIEEIHIKNTLMLDLYSDQKNLLIIQGNQNENGYLFNSNNTALDIPIKK